jgi:glycosyltransferase involved in cell wall biosynthesis
MDGDAPAELPERRIPSPSGPRVLFLARALPTPDRDSGSERTVQLLRLLRNLGCAVDFAPEQPPAPRECTVLHDLGVRVIPARPLREPSVTHAEADYRAIVVCRYFLAEYWLPLLRWRFPRAKLIVDTVDLHFLREERSAQVRASRSGSRLARATRRRELASLAASDEAWVVSPAERDLLAEHLPELRVEVVPNLHEPQDAPGAFDERSGLVFIGGAAHPPNLDAIHWLLEAIYPRVAREDPAIRLHLVGPGLAAALGDGLPAGVTCHDYVEDLGPLLAHVRVGLAPLRFGAGVKGKVGQCIAHGVPIVATPCAVEGMHLTHEVDVLIAADAASFADEILRLHRDPALWTRLARSGMDSLRRHFSPASVADTLRTSVLATR